MNKNLILNLIIILSISFTNANANALYPVSIEEKINNSTRIIEGKVVSKISILECCPYCNLHLQQSESL